MIHGRTLALATEGFSDIQDLTDDLRETVRESGISEGVVHVFSVGSTGSITTIEFEPALVKDMKEALEKLWPHDMRSHHSETWGDDNGFSHLRSAFLGPSLSVPVHEGEPVLGTWQQVVVLCHDNRPRERKVFLQVMGE